MSSPSTSTVPSVGRSSAPISDSSEVLPDPDGPVSAVKSPGSSVSEIPSSATIESWGTRRTSVTLTCAPPRPVAPAAGSTSASDTDPIVELLRAAPPGMHHDSEDQPVPDGPSRPDDRPVPVASPERIGRVATRVAARALTRPRVRARVLGRYDLTAIQELVV